MQLVILNSWRMQLRTINPAIKISTYISQISNCTKTMKVLHCVSTFLISTKKISTATSGEQHFRPNHFYATYRSVVSFLDDTVTQRKRQYFQFKKFRSHIPGTCYQLISSINFSWCLLQDTHFVYPRQNASC